MDDHSIARAAGLIADAHALLVAAGAGMGVDSGLPDFRSSAGFWQAYPALGRRRLAFECVASPHWGERLPHGCGVFTSNVDGHFQRSGFGDHLVECHGSIQHLQCSVPCRSAIWPADHFEPMVDTDACRLLNDPPTCPHCGALARPNILMFGDGAWQEGRTSAQETSLALWLDSVRRLVVVELGAGTAAPWRPPDPHQPARGGRADTGPCVDRRAGAGGAAGHSAGAGPRRLNTGPQAARPQRIGTANQQSSPMPRRSALKCRPPEPHSD